MDDTEKGAEHTGQSVRQMLATRTRAAHETLHEHPWIASLLDPALTMDLYCTVLGAYHGFYEQVVKACSTQQLPENLLLDPARDQLQNDLCCLERYRQHGPHIPVQLNVDGRVELMGILYVLHGASFGAAILNRSVRRALPDAPRHFLESGIDRDSWQQLILELEHFSRDDLARERLVNSANSTFHAFGSHVTRYCESRHGSRHPHTQDCSQ